MSFYSPLLNALNKSLRVSGKKIIRDFIKIFIKKLFNKKVVKIILKYKNSKNFSLNVLIVVILKMVFYFGILISLKLKVLIGLLHNLLNLIFVNTSLKAERRKICFVIVSDILIIVPLIKKLWIIENVN